VLLKCEPPPGLPINTTTSSLANFLTCTKSPTKLTSSTLYATGIPSSFILIPNNDVKYCLSIIP
jgi:hypothetical protein